MQKSINFNSFCASFEFVCRSTSNFICFLYRHLSNELMACGVCSTRFCMRCSFFCVLSCYTFNSLQIESFKALIDLQLFSAKIVAFHLFKHKQTNVFTQVQQRIDQNMTIFLEPYHFFLSFSLSSYVIVDLFSVCVNKIEWHRKNAVFAHRKSSRISAIDRGIFIWLQLGKLSVRFSIQVGLKTSSMC